MDAALLLSLLEANCSLALAEELLLDGWGEPPDPEGRQEAREVAARGLAPWLSSSVGLSGAPVLGPPPLSLCALPPVSRSLLLLQHDLGPDRDLLAPERAWSPSGETMPRILQRHQVQHDPECLQRMPGEWDLGLKGQLLTL
uniref:CRF2a variant form 3 n=1 Tax=Rattus norvegicus TaxID=10116 RepID=A1YKY1_RAT|nr:CRF2a variant form 3 [Rattus norvegicus]